MTNRKKKHGSLFRAIRGKVQLSTTYNVFPTAIEEIFDSPNSERSPSPVLTRLIDPHSNRSGMAPKNPIDNHTLARVLSAFFCHEHFRRNSTLDQP